MVRAQVSVYTPLPPAVHAQGPWKRSHLYSTRPVIKQALCPVCCLPCCLTASHLDHTSPLQVSAADVPAELGQFWTAALHPKNPNLALAAGSNSIQLWDLSSMRSTGGIHTAHKLPVRDVSWAPNNEHRFVTGGDDGKLRFWDTR